MGLMCQSESSAYSSPVKLPSLLCCSLLLTPLQPKTLQQSKQPSLQSLLNGVTETNFGAAHFWSFIVTHRPHENWLIHGGLSYILIPGPHTMLLYAFPVSVSYLVRWPGRTLELNARLLISIPAEMGYRTADRKGLRATSTSQAFTPEFGIGYAYFPKNDGWYFRATGYTVYGRDPKKISIISYTGAESPWVECSN